MGAVVDILATKVPPVDLEDLVLASGRDGQLLPPDLHAMCGLDGLIERQASETSAELGLPDAAVAEEDHLHLVLGLGSEAELGKVGAQPGEAVVAVARKNLPRHADRLVGKKRGQAWVVCEGSQERGRDYGLAAKEVEVLKSLES